MNSKFFYETERISMGVFADDLLQDKVVLITGGGTGLGRAMGSRFLELGAKLAICGRREDILIQTAEDLGTEHNEIFYKSCDVRDPDQVQALVAAVEERFGRIDVLVNNAAGNFISPTERLSHRAVDAVLGIVLHGTFYMTLEVGKSWIGRQQSGTMLNIVTTYANTGSGYVVPSAAAKAGVLALTRSLAVEWAPYGISASGDRPGPVSDGWGLLSPLSYTGSGRKNDVSPPSWSNRVTGGTGGLGRIPRFGCRQLYQR